MAVAVESLVADASRHAACEREQRSVELTFLFAYSHNYTYFSFHSGDIHWHWLHCFQTKL